MAQKQPTFNVSFKEEAVLSIQKQERNTVVLILDDDTNKDVDKVTYRGLADVKKSDYTTDNYDLLTLAFMGNPYKVVVLKVEKTETEQSTTIDLNATLSKLDFYNNYILSYPDATSEAHTAIKNKLKAQRDKNNYSIAILGNAVAPDVNYIVNFATNSIQAVVNDEEKTFNAGEYTARIAGALSGLAATRSLTYYDLPEITTCQISTDEDADAAAGKLIVLFQDGGFKLGRAVNSLTTLTDGLTAAFQKVRVSGIMDMISNDVVTTFRTGYVGKYINNFTNKNRLCGAINSYLSTLADEGSLEAENQNAVEISYQKQKEYIESKGISTDKMAKMEILKYNTGSKVLLDGVCSPTDAMEDIDLGVFLFQQLGV